MEILSTAPSRISLFGGGTDIEPYTSQEGGMVVNLAINLRQHVSLKPDHLTYQIPTGAKPEFYSPFFDEFGSPNCGLVNNYDGIIESGLGSSASCAVALVGALARLQNCRLTKDQIAQKAWDIEVNRIGLYGGKQDQWAAAYGGFSLMEFNSQGVHVLPLLPSLARQITPAMVLLYTGANRKSATIQEGFRSLTPTQKEKLDGIKKTADEAVTAIGCGDIEQVGILLDRSWELKKKSNANVSTPRIDELYDQGKKLGAWGGKVLGAGGGGFMLFMVDPSKRHTFIEGITRSTDVSHWDFSVCWNGLETRSIT